VIVRDSSEHAPHDRSQTARRDFLSLRKVMAASNDARLYVQQDVPCPFAKPAAAWRARPRKRLASVEEMS